MLWVVTSPFKIPDAPPKKEVFDILISLRPSKATYPISINDEASQQTANRGTPCCMQKVLSFAQSSA